ncbi:MAG: outer membrane beta-barrel protein [Terracidiphilus sp.]
MKSIIKSVFVGLCATALLLALSNSAQAQVASGSGELAVNGGWNNNLGTVNSDGTVSKNAYSFGGSAGYNLSENIAVLGEYQYVPEGSFDTVTWKTQFYGGALRYAYGSSKFSPYVLIGGGGVATTLSSGNESASVSGEYIAFGGGVSIFLGKNWGIRPEFRYNDLFSSSNGTTTTQGVPQLTGGLFFQFGGEQSSKKKASSGN